MPGSLENNNLRPSRTCAWPTLAEVDHTFLVVPCAPRKREGRPEKGVKNVKMYLTEPVQENNFWQVRNRKNA